MFVSWEDKLVGYPAAMTTGGLVTHDVLRFEGDVQPSESVPGGLAIAYVECRSFTGK